MPILALSLCEKLNEVNSFLFKPFPLFFLPTSDMTLRLLNVTRFSVAMVSGIVLMTEGLRSGAGALASCGNGRRRRDEDRRSSTLAVTGALVDECRRDRCMDESADWTTQTNSTTLANNMNENNPSGA